VSGLAASEYSLSSRSPWALSGLLCALCGSARE